MPLKKSNLNSYDYSTDAYTVYYATDPGGIFQTVGAGSHYLATTGLGSTYRNAGTPNLNAGLLAELKKKTTWPPVVWVNPITVATPFTPQVPQDTDTPDLGYHYDPLDYALSGITLNNATLTLSCGVALGTYGSSSSAGISVGAGGKVISEGSPTQPNWIVRYNTVQEQATANWSAASQYVAASIQMGVGSGQEARFRFTDWSLLGNNGYHFYAAFGGPSANTLSFQDCQFGGGRFSCTFFYSCDLNNCLWERVACDANSGSSFHMYNNLVRGGSWLFYFTTYYSDWIAQDNLFDACSLHVVENDLINDHNGYVNIPTLPASGGSDKTLTSADYQIGPLGGRYYYPTTGGNLSRLIGAGSRTAIAAGLDVYTTQTDQITDSGTVDIGFHYKVFPIGPGFWTDYSPSPEQLAKWIMGPGFTVNNVNYNTGARVARGVFGNGADANLPIVTGVILSSGDIALAKGPNDHIGIYSVGKSNRTGPDPDLENLVPGLVTKDAAVLEFDFISASATSIAFDYVFASEEYHFYIGPYNDIMAIWVDDVNIAVVPNTTPPLPIAVNNIHDGNPPIPAKNSQYFVNNEDPPTRNNIQYNGLTTLLTAQTAISPGVSHHIKIAIADATDQALDSAVFIKATVCP